MSTGKLLFLIFTSTLLSLFLGIFSSLIAGYIAPNFSHRKWLPWGIVLIVFLLSFAISLYYEMNKQGDKERDISKIGSINVGDHAEINSLTQITAQNIKMEKQSSDEEPNIIISDLSIEQFDWKPEKIVSFAISNVGGGIAIVTKIFLDVQNVEKYDHFGVKHPGAILIPYEYKIKLDPNKKKYIVNKNPFFYRKGDTDAFRIQLSSNEGFAYEFKFNIEWRDVKKQNLMISSSDIHKSNFPIKDKKEILRRLKSKNKK